MLQALIAVLAVALTIMVMSRSKLKGLQRVGPSRGWFYERLPSAKREFQLRGREIVKEAYWKFQKQNFIIQTLDMDILVVAPHFLPEIRMLPESKMSHSVALVQKYLGYYSGVDVILASRHHIDVCRLPLTQNLDYFVPRMHQAYIESRTQFLKRFPEPTTIPAYEFVFSMVLAITSSVFVGEATAKDPAWLEVVSAYLKEVVTVAKTLKPYPAVLRPLLRPLIAPKHPVQAVYRKADKLLAQPIRERREDPSKHKDVMAFLAKSQPEVDQHQIVLQLMVLVSAALHTSTMAAVQALYDLCVMPDTEAMLRKEVKQALSDEQAWTLDTIKKLPMLDSFLKESFRCNQPESLGYSRIATSSVQLSDGTVIPQGTYISMAAEAMASDPQFYSSPDKFDPLRFFRQDRDAANSNQSQEHEFAGIERGNVAWGSGRSTCPGRWYASALNKLIIGDLLAHYKVMLPDGQKERPASIHDNGAIIPNPAQKLLLQAT